MSSEVYLTPEGKEKLERELKELVETKRPELALKLKDAIADGDLKENANYHDAKEQQAFLEARIREIERTLRAAIIVEDSDETGLVQVGSEVTIVDLEYDETETYRIVGAAESDPSRGYISNESPIGAALLGKKRGDSVKVKTPGGVMEFKIKKIK